MNPSKSPVIQYLISLENKLDATLFARPGEDENGLPLKTVAGVGLAGAAGAGGYAADRAIMSKYGTQNLLTDSARAGTGRFNPKQSGRGSLTLPVSRSQAYRAAASDVGQRAGDAVRAGGIVGKQTYNVLRENAAAGPVEAALKAGLQGVKVGARKLFSTRDRLVTLEAKLDTHLSERKAVAVKPCR
jgi:hypothetical protein